MKDLDKGQVKVMAQHVSEGMAELFARYGVQEGDDEVEVAKGLACDLAVAIFVVVRKIKKTKLFENHQIRKIVTMGLAMTLLANGEHEAVNQ